MKTNYNFPYQFIDLTNSDICIIETRLEEKELIFSIEFREYYFNPNIDIVLEVESTQTFYRKLFILEKSNSSIKIQNDYLGSKINYSILLVSKHTGEIELNGNIDYYEVGDCLGILAKSAINFEEEKGFAGLIKIAPSNRNNITYDLTSDWITIELPKDTYDKFYPWHNDDANTPIALASLGNSCIQFAIIKALRQNDYKEKKWWETLTQLLTDKGYSIDDMDEDEVPNATNRILGNCIQEMVNTLVPKIDHGDTSILA